MKAIYHISGLSTLSRGMGKCGICITLDGSIANQILNSKIRRSKCLLLDMMYKELDNRYGQIEFIKDSWLLRYIQLEPMSCSCFGIDGMRIDSINDGRDISWTPHNIDTPEQAAKLASIWLFWFEYMATLEDKDGKPIVEIPFSM